MKKLLVKALFLALTGVFPVSAAWSQVEEHDHKISHKIALSDVRFLEVEGRFNVVLSQGTQEGVEIDTPCEVLDEIVTKQSGKTFKISIKDKVAQQYKLIFVRIAINNPEQIVLKGSPKMKMFDALTCQKISLQLSGTSAFSGDIRAAESIEIKMDGQTAMQSSLTAVKSCKVELSGNATVEAEGYVPSMTLVQGGNTRFGSKEFRTDKLDARLSGLSKTVLSVNKTLKATVSDAATFYYSGMPKTDVSLSGVAKVEKF
ncbi:MAG: DUF2807 domain-containing protein [Bacteroides sp.]|nr:DUF2807 domain-containing protein [Ruminococcus flavefaciens]MCM1555293.1 DUF2807 domain-containing protein [Bacteroides sp.]